MTSGVWRKVVQNYGIHRINCRVLEILGLLGSYGQCFVHFLGCLELVVDIKIESLHLPVDDYIYVVPLVGIVFVLNEVLVVEFNLLVEAKSEENCHSFSLDLAIFDCDLLNVSCVVELVFITVCQV